MSQTRPASRTFFRSSRAALAAGLTVAALLAASAGAFAQAPDPAPAAAPADTTAQPATIPLQNPTAKTRKKDDKVVQTKDTKAANKTVKKTGALDAMDVKLPDKQLYDKAVEAIRRGRYDVARLDLQTMLNTYPESQYQMRAKLAIADSWFKEGGTAALTQAEQEFKDFIVFFPNAPEAAEAAMRVGDIYFKEMDRPDRDYSKATNAQEAYRTMLQQFPESTLAPQATQRLREVQESLASREADIASFYATHQNWPATIARYQTVVDTYPLYSHMDDTLIGLGDAYEAEARFVRTLNLPEGPKARLEKTYDDQAAAAYRKVVLEHSAAPHVEDARDRLAAMNLPIPTPTAEQLAASAALENSRGQYTLSNRVEFFILHKADTVPAARIGDASLEDPKPTLAPTIINRIKNDFNTAMSPAVNKPGALPAPAAAAITSPAPATLAPAQAPAAPLAFQDVPAADAASGSNSAVISVPSATGSTPSTGGTSVGIEIVQPGAGSPTAPVTPPTSAPVFPGTPATAVADPSGGLKPVGPPNATPMAAIEKPAAAPETINDLAPGSQPAAQPATTGKKAKAAFDKDDESSSKHKKKKGLAKLNPF